MSASAIQGSTAAAADAQPPRDVSAVPRIRTSLIVGGILLATIIVYLRCLRDGFVWDDQVLIVNNPLIGQWSFLWKSLSRDEYWFFDPFHLPQVSRYRPLLLVWFALNYHAFALNAAGWHAAMVAVHAIAAWLVFRIAERITGRRQTAALAALFFGLTPLHAEAVIWAGAFSLVLSSAFQFASFLYFIERAESKRRNWILALGFFAAATMTQEGSLIFPGLIAAYVVLLEGSSLEFRGVDLWKRLRSAIECASPFAAEAILYLIARKAVLGLFTTASANHSTIQQFLLTMPRVLATYLILPVVPWLAGTTHRLTFVTTASSPAFLVPMALLLVVAVTALLIFQRHPRGDLYLFCLVWMVIAVLPMLYLRGLLADYLVADNYAYLSSFGWCVMLADVLVSFAMRGERAMRLAYGAAALIALAYAVGLWRIEPLWHDDLTLFTQMVQDFPESPRGRASLGVELRRQGDLTGAARELRASFKLDPENGATLYELGEVHAQLGRAALGAREVAEGIRIEGRAPAYAYMVLAQLYDMSGNFGKSEEVLRYAETLNDGPHAAGLARARIKINRRDFSSAQTLLQDLTIRYPNDYRVWSMMGQALAAQDRTGDALTAYRRAISLDPGDPQNHLAAAQLLHVMSRDREAMTECRIVLALTPDDPNVRQLIAQIAPGQVAR